jgi:hypothetical protein
VAGAGPTWRTGGEVTRAAQTLEAWSRLVQSEGEPARAVAIYAAAEAVRKETGASPSPGQRKESEASLASMRGALEPSAFALAWGQGEAMSQEAAVSFVA